MGCSGSTDTASNNVKNTTLVDDKKKSEVKSQKQDETLIINPNTGMTAKEEKILDEVISIESKRRELDEKNDEFVKEESVKLAKLEDAVAVAAIQEMELETQAMEALGDKAAAEEDERRLEAEEEETKRKIREAEEEIIRLEALKLQEGDEAKRREIEEFLAIAAAEAAEQERRLQAEEEERLAAVETARIKEAEAVEAFRLAEIAAEEEKKREAEYEAELKNANEKEATIQAEEAALDQEEAQKLNDLREEEARVQAAQAHEPSAASAIITPTPPVKLIPDSKLGFINKRGRTVRTWNVRYFVLDSGVLTYFEKPSNASPYGINEKGKIPSLKGKKITRDGELVSIVGGTERDITLKFDNQIAKDEWIKAIESHIEFATKNHK